MRPLAQRGNILFLILLAVVLFAALTYAVTSSQKGGVKDASKESNAVNAATYLQWSTLLEQTVTRLRTTGGCKDSELNFINTPTGNNYKNLNAPIDKHCNVFDPAGGGMAYMSGGLFWGSFLVEGIGTSAIDLLLDIPVPVKICIAINDLLGIPNTGADGPPSDKIAGGTEFVGEYVPSTDTGSNTKISDPEFIGRYEGCRINTGSGSTASPRYYRVLIAR